MLRMAFIPGVATANWRPEPGFALAGQSTGTEVTCKEESLMKATIALLGAALALSACTRVIERPVPTATGPAVVTTPALSERVVERPSAASGATALGPGACAWAGQATSNGGMSCQQGSQYRCNNGTWQQTALSCSQ
jgi:hypothetical protein